MDVNVDIDGGNSIFYVLLIEKSKDYKKLLRAYSVTNNLPVLIYP